jgi:hypothetical protein
MNKIYSLLRIHASYEADISDFFLNKLSEFLNIHTITEFLA